jgi:universal stress protein E
MTPKALHRVLVANDSLDGLPQALEKAALIEHQSGAEVLVVTTTYDSIAEEPAEILPRHEQARLIEALKAAERVALHRLVAPFETHLATLETRLLWTKDAAQTITETAAKWGAELLIKPMSRHHRIADYFHAPLDWSLTRQAACAVLVVKGGDWSPTRPVLAAVDMADAAHPALSREVLRTADLLARMLGADLHVVTAYPDLGQRVDELQVATDFTGIKADMWANRRNALAVMLDELDLTATEIHVLEGKPVQVIPRLEEQLQPALTVLGTAARRGLSRLIIGNTAEQLLGRLRGDLVTVREPWS